MLKALIKQNSSGTKENKRMLINTDIHHTFGKYTYFVQQYYS